MAGIKLSRRELQILNMVARGSTSREIAATLCISVRTVECHRANMMQKLNVRRASEMVRVAYVQGLIDVAIA